MALDRPETAAVESAICLNGGHQTRRRAGSLIKPPARFDHSPASASGPVPIQAQPTHAPPTHQTRSTSPVTAKTSPGLRLSMSVPVPSGSSSSPAGPQQTPPPPRPASQPRSRVPQFPLLDSYQPDPAAAEDRRHPRELVPEAMQWPPAHLAGRIRREDRDDRLLMATCQILHDHHNRALVPKEVAEVMFQRQWLHNAGTTPFAHISTCIRAHLRRCSVASPPYTPLLTSFELVGALTPIEVRAVGLNADERPAVKRGTLWYLDERVLGTGQGAEDPFVRCRREAGLTVAEQMAHRTQMSHSIFNNPGNDDDDENGGMGRGKRKRRASHALLAAENGGEMAPPAGLAIPSLSAQAHAHRRSQSVAVASSAPAATGVPRLRLRLTSLEEVDSALDESDGQTSDAIARRKTKKKQRRATSTGLRARSPHSSDGSDGDLTESDEDQPRLSLSVPSLSVSSRPGGYSHASASDLVSECLRKASISQRQATAAKFDATSPSIAICPESLHYSRPLGAHHLSLSAPNLFSAFPSLPSPELMEVDNSASDYYSYKPQAGSAVDDADDESADDEDDNDYHEAMLRGEDFEFEWGSESYTAPSVELSSSGQLPRSRAMSVELAEPFSVNGDGSSTPATTPRSPGETAEAQQPLPTRLEATLCAAYDDDKPSPVKQERAASSDSLSTLVDSDEETKPNIDEDDDRTETLSARPIPSPLELELPTLDLATSTFSTEAASHSSHATGGTEWSMKFDLDELDLELGGGVSDLLGPETVGLDELDLAWTKEDH